MKKQLLITVLGLFSVASFAQKKELKSAEKAIKNKDYSSALTTINSLSSSIDGADDKYKAQYYFLKAKAFFGKKDYQASADSFTKLLNFEKQSGKSKYSAQSKDIMNQITGEVSKRANELYNNKKDYAGAAKDFYLTYQLSPRDTIFAYYSAVSATQAKDYDTAVKRYKELLKNGYKGIEEQFVATNKKNGKVEVMSSKVERDLKVKSGQYINPSVKYSESKQGSILKNLALLLNEQGKIEEANKVIVEARKANPKDVGLILTSAEIYRKMGQMNKFKNLTQEALSISPNDPVLHYNVGVVSASQGLTDEAISHYKKAIELKPDYADAYMNVAAAILEKDKAVVEEMNKNLSNFKKYDKLALKQKGIYREALPYLEKVDELNRNFDTVRTLRSIYEVLGMKGKADKYTDLYNSMK